MSALNTDFYELTMAAGYFLAGRAVDVATFELSVRRLPEERNYLIAAGLQQAIEYLQAFRFTKDEMDYLRGLSQLQNAPAEFFDYLSNLRFTGSLFAVPEGTPIFENEPIAIIRAPLIQAQIVETYLLSTFIYQTLVASKAARCAAAAQGRPVVEFGSRRAHSPTAGVWAGRAAYLGGCSGTSNTEAGMRFGIPVFGTAAHSWTMAFGDEEEAFRALQRLLGESTVFLIDTYDTLEGARLTTRIGRPLWGVRLDSGDLCALSREVRRILDGAGLRDVKIFATNELDEHRMAALLRDGAAIDAFGVGTRLVTSNDAPSLSAVYKMVELERAGQQQYTAKFSSEKSTLPAAKQIYRCAGHDVIGLYSECNSDYEGSPLVRPVLMNGELLEDLPRLADSREYSTKAVAALPSELHDIEKQADYRIDMSPKLFRLAEELRSQLQAVR